MTVTALVLSGIAVLVSIAAFLRGELRESDRRHDELTPRLDLRYMAEADPPRIRLRNDGPRNYDQVQVTLIPPSRPRDVRFNALVLTDAQGAPAISTTASLGPLLMGNSAFFGLQRGSKPDDETVTVRLRCRCTAGRHEWTTVATCEIPGVPRITVFG